MRQITTLLLITLCFSSCLKKSDVIMREQGVVVEKQYKPSISGTASGFGISSNGGTTFTSHDISEKEKYIVIFKCDHGVVFSMNKSELYGKLNTGDTVMISYHEMLNRKGVVKDYDFVDANKK